MQFASKILMGALKLFPKLTADAQAFQKRVTCYRRKLNRLAGKIYLIKRNALKTVFFSGQKSLWEDLEAKLMTPGQLLGYP